MAVTMPEKRILPLGNPPQEKSRDSAFKRCPYCPFESKFEGSLQRHINRYHQEELSRKGVKSLREGGIPSKFAHQFGMVTCPACGVSWGNQRWLDWHLANSHSEKEVKRERAV